MSDTLHTRQDYYDDMAAHSDARAEVVLPIDIASEYADQLVIGAYNAVKQNGGKVAATAIAVATLAQTPTFEQTAAPDNHPATHLVIDGRDAIHSPVSIAGIEATKIVVSKGETVRSIATEASQKTHVPEVEIERGIVSTNHLSSGNLVVGEVIEAPKVVAPAPEITANVPSTNETLKKPTIYYIGDSITVGDLEAGLVQDLANNGWSVSKAEANVGDNVGEGQQRLAADTAQIQAATHAIIELGTNNQVLGVPNPTADSEQEFDGAIEGMVSSLKKINPNIEITWVTPHDENTNVDASIISSIKSMQTKLGYDVIDWDAYAKAHPELNFDKDMGVHLDPSGYAEMSRFIADSIGKAPTAAVPPTPTKPAAEAPVTTTTQPPDPAAPVIPETQGDPETNDANLAIEQIVGYVHDKYGMPINGIAAMAGNMKSESFPGPNAERLEGYYHVQVPIQTLSEAQINNTAPQESGWGIVQFTPVSKYIDWGKANNIALEDLNSIYYQLDFIMFQLKTEPEYQPLYNLLMSPTLDPTYGAEMFMKYYERPLGSTTIPFTGPAAESLPTRQAQAQAIFNQFNAILNPPPPPTTTTTTEVPTTTSAPTSSPYKQSRPTGRISKPTGRAAYPTRPRGRRTNVSGIPRNAHTHVNRSTARNN